LKSAISDIKKVIGFKQTVGNKTSDKKNGEDSGSDMSKIFESRSEEDSSDESESGS